MATYYRHKLTHRREIPYSFKCEHCMQNSGPLTATIIGTQAEYKTPFRQLTEAQSETLKQNAHKFLVNKVYRNYTDATEKNIYTPDFKDICPHCQKTQSWAISGLKDEMQTNSVVVAVVGLIVAAGAYFFAVRNIVMALVIFGAFLAVAAVMWLVAYTKIQKRVSSAAGVAQERLPNVDWSAAQDLINEKLAEQVK